MSELDSRDLLNWRYYIEDYIIIARYHINISGQELLSHSIINKKYKIPYRIEDRSINEKLASEMIDEGVPVYSHEEGLKILFGDRYIGA